MERKSFVYYSAIQSIKKYPLPIICLQQLKILYGLGELLCEELIKVIKEHYSVFLKKGKEESERGEEGEIDDF